MLNKNVQKLKYDIKKYVHLMIAIFYPRIKLKLIIISTIFVQQSAIALINAKDLHGYSDLVRLNFKNGWICTGSYIDPYTILTSAHCLWGLNSPKELALIQSEYDKTLDTVPLKFIIHPKYSEQFLPLHDLGLIKTTKYNFFKGNFTLSSNYNQTFGDLKIFGAGKADPNVKTYFRTTGENKFLKVSNIILFLGRSCKTEELGQFVSIASNDSGGPVVDAENGKIIGIASQTTSKGASSYCLPAFNLATSIISSENFKFINDNLTNIDGVKND